MTTISSWSSIPRPCRTVSVYKGTGLEHIASSLRLLEGAHRSIFYLIIHCVDGMQELLGCLSDGDIYQAHCHHETSE